MAGRFDLESVWHDENFSVRKGILPAETTFPGIELGDGLIYYAGPNTVKHRILDDVTGTHTVAGETGHKMRCLWNSGSHMQIMNPSEQPARFIQIKLNYKPMVSATPLSDEAAALAMACLLHDRWSPVFKASVAADLDAIGDLAQRVEGTSLTLHARDLPRAARAKEDLEFKIAWFAAAIRERSMAAHHDEASYGDHTQFFMRRFSSHFFGFKEVGRADPSIDGSVKVIVNTKDPDGRTDIPGYEVWATSAANEDDLRRAERFPRLSTPTTKRLSVGKYVMWAKRRVPGPLSTVLVGSLDRPSEREQIVDLFAAEP